VPVERQDGAGSGRGRRATADEELGAVCWRDLVKLRDSAGRSEYEWKKSRPSWRRESSPSRPRLQVVVFLPEVMGAASGRRRARRLDNSRRNGLPV